MNELESNAQLRKKNREKVNDTLTPLMIQWLKAITKTHEGDIVKIDDIILDKVVVVGRLVSLKSENTKTYIYIEDGSDSLRLVSNKKFDEELPKILREIETQKKNIYLKAILDINFYQSETLYTPIKLSQLQNLNYLTYHFLNCLYSQKIRMNGFSSTDGPRVDEELRRRGEDEDDPSNNNTFLVLEKMREINKKSGGPVSLEDIVKELKGKLNPPAITEVIEQLQENSEIRRTAPDIYDFY